MAISNEKLREILDFCQLYGKEKAAEKIDIPLETLNRYLRDAKTRGLISPEEKFDIEQNKGVELNDESGIERETFKLPKPSNWRELIDIAQKHKEIREKNSYGRTAATVRIKDKNAIVMFVGDLHLGADGTDYNLFLELTEYIKNNNIYVVLLGDEIDSFMTSFKNASAVFGQILSPKEQHELLADWLNEIYPWVLCASHGNHSEQFIEANLGFALANKIKEKYVDYFGGIGKLKVKIGNQQYDFGMTHKFNRKSCYNPLHGAYTMARELMDGDLFANAHYHEPAIGVFKVREKLVPAIQTGTLKTNDAYGKRYFNYGESLAKFPAVFIDGEERKLIPFMECEDAIIYKKGYDLK